MISGVTSRLASAGSAMGQYLLYEFDTTLPIRPVLNKTLLIASRLTRKTKAFTARLISSSYRLLMGSAPPPPEHPLRDYFRRLEANPFEQITHFEARTLEIYGLSSGLKFIEPLMLETREVLSRDQTPGTKASRVISGVYRWFRRGVYTALAFGALSAGNLWFQTIESVPF